jgi:lipopolysaccharide export LptBFGC system permease protein LptF
MKPGTFYKDIPGTLILAGDFNQDSGVIKGLLMVRKVTSGDEKGEMIIAEKGIIEQPPEGSNEIILRLENGTIHPLASKPSGYRSGAFRNLMSRITNEAPDSGLKSRQILMAASGSQLRSWLRTGADGSRKEDLISYALELNRRIAVPIAVLLYPLIVFPAAITTGRHGKAAAFTISLLLFLSTFFLSSIGSNMAHQGLVNPTFGAWFPDLLLLTLGLTVITTYFFKQRVPKRRTVR